MIIARLTDGRTNLWQYDTGVKVVFLGTTSLTECHFPTPSGLVCRSVIDNICEVPDEALLDHGTLEFYAFEQTQEHGITRHEVRFDVHKRPKPTGYVDPPDEYDNLEEQAKRVAPLIPGGGSVSADELKAAVDQYMEENPLEIVEVDPNVPDWAKQTDPPKYSADEVGAQPKGDYALRSEIPSVPVQSVNGKTGEVTLTAQDVGALPKDAEIVDATARKDIAELSEEKVDKVLFDEVFEIREASVNLYEPQTAGWLNNASIITGGYPEVNDATRKAYCVTPHIPVNGGVTYTIAPAPFPNSLAAKNSISFYDSNGTAFPAPTIIRNDDDSVTFTAPGGAATVRFTAYRPNYGGTSISLETLITNFNLVTMIVEGTDLPSEYVPYYPAGNAMKNIAIPDKSVTLETIGDDSAPVIAPLLGKTVANFGDSIFGNARPPVDVSTYIADNTGATVYNCAFGGCRMGVHTGHWDAFSMYRLADAIANNDYSLQDEALGYDDRTSYAEEPLAEIKSIDFSSLDILTIAYGANDFTGNNAVDNAENPLDTNTFCGAFRYSVETLLTALPNLRIFVLLPTWRFWVDADNNNAYVEDTSTYTNSLGKTLAEYSEALAEAAKGYNLPVIDNYTELGINKFNRYQYFNANDGAHHAENGRKLLAKHIAAKLW